MLLKICFQRKFPFICKASLLYYFSLITSKYNHFNSNECPRMCVCINGNRWGPKGGFNPNIKYDIRACKQQNGVQKWRPFANFPILGSSFRSIDRKVDENQPRKKNRSATLRLPPRLPPPNNSSCCGRKKKPSSDGDVEGGVEEPKKGLITKTATIQNKSKRIKLKKTRQLK